MISFSGHLYDGKTSAQTDAVCRIYDNGALRLDPARGGPPLLSQASVDRIRFSPRLADTPRYLYFPGGEKFETEDNDAVDRLLARYRKGGWSALIHKLETRKRYVLGAVALMILFTYVMVVHGVPSAARVIAFALPDRVARMASEQTREALDRALFEPSELPETVRRRIVEHFGVLNKDHPDLSISVLFRKGGRIGPNALALPDGTVIFTDEMVSLAQHDDELLSVLSHETGHVLYRHGLRTVIQDSLLAFAMLAVTGDVSGTSEMFYALPVMLTELAYSRKFEQEADRYALDYLRSRDIEPAHFSRLMRRIEKWQEEKRGSRDPGKWSSYLSTHPDIEDRLKAFDQ